MNNPFHRINSHYISFKTIMAQLALMVLMSGFVVTASAQRQGGKDNTAHAFSKDVAVIQKYDKIYRPVDNPILFVGSSSIRKWITLQRDFGKYDVINRGVGGFVTNDLIYFADQLIFKYKPREIIMYVGENDLPQETATADTVFQRFVKLYTLIRSRLPGIPFGYIALKPSPSRPRYYDKAVAANKLIQEYLAKQANTRFFDIFTPMTKDGKARKELFVGDMLHMNPKGYAIWEKQVRPYLLKP